MNLYAIFGAFLASLARLGTQPIFDYFAVYVLVLVTPGPNLALMGGVAALRGFRGALPMAVGLCTGVACLGLVVYLLAAQLPDAWTWSMSGRIAAAFILVWVAFRVAMTRAPFGGQSSMEVSRPADFFAGFITALTNPVTGAFFLAQCLGPIGQMEPPTVIIAIAITALVAFTYSATIAWLMSHSVIQRRLQKAFVPIKRILAASILVMAAIMLKPLVL